MSTKLNKEQQIVKLMEEGYTYQQASERLEYIPVEENNNEERDDEQ